MLNPLAIGAAVGLGLLTLFAGSSKSKEPGSGETKTPPRKGRETAAEAFARGQREAKAAVETETKAKRIEEKRIGKLVESELLKRGVNRPAKVVDLADDDDEKLPKGDKE